MIGSLAQSFQCVEVQGVGIFTTGIRNYRVFEYPTNSLRYTYILRCLRLYLIHDLLRSIAVIVIIVLVDVGLTTQS